MEMLSWNLSFVMSLFFYIYYYKVVVYRCCCCCSMIFSVAKFYCSVGMPLLQDSTYLFYASSQIRHLLCISAQIRHFFFIAAFIPLYFTVFFCMLHLWILFVLIRRQEISPHPFLIGWLLKNLVHAPSLHYIYIYTPGTSAIVTIAVRAAMESTPNRDASIIQQQCCNCHWNFLCCSCPHSYFDSNYAIRFYSNFLIRLIFFDSIWLIFPNSIRPCCRLFLLELHLIHIPGIAT